MRQGSKILLLSLILVILALLAFIFFQFKKGNLAVFPKASPMATSLPELEEKEEVSNFVSEIDLEVTAPEDGAIVTTASLTVTGKTVGGGEVFINDVTTKADANGNFSAKLTLDEGENTISVLANDENGNYAEKEITVSLNTE